MITKMLNKRLEVDHESSQAFELLRFNKISSAEVAECLKESSLEDKKINTEENLGFEDKLQNLEHLERIASRDRDNDDKIDIEQSSRNFSVKPLPDVINTDVGAYASYTSINTTYPGEWIRRNDFLTSREKKSTILVKMDDPNITMEEYIRLKEEKARSGVLYKVEDISTYLVEYVKFWDDWEVDRYGDANLVIMEYLVNISKRRAFWSLNEDILKITILKTNTPYPSRKIRRIRACTHERSQRNKAQYAVSREDKYTVLETWNEYNILEDIKRGPYYKKFPIRRIQSLDTPY
ncbi:hypothetical protein Tco_0428845 [Tanacetum coccineum]